MLKAIDNVIIQLLYLAHINVSPETVNVLLLAWIISNIVSTMPTPNCNGFLGSPLYKWLFNALHGIMGNIGRVLHDKISAIFALVFGNSGGNNDAPKP